MSCYHESTPSAVTEKNWDTGKVHDVCIVHTAVGEDTPLDEATSNSEEIKPVALSIIKFHC